MYVGTERHDTATDLKSQKVPYSERQSQHFTSFIWRNRQFSMNERRIHVNSMNRSKLIWTFTNEFTVTSTSEQVFDFQKCVAPGEREKKDSI